MNSTFQKPVSAKAKRFIELAEKRTNNVLKEINKIGNLSSGYYEYDEAQVKKMFDAIEGALEQAKTKYPYYPKKTFKLS